MPLVTKKNGTRKPNPTAVSFESSASTSRPRSAARVIIPAAKPPSSTHSIEVDLIAGEEEQHPQPEVGEELDEVVDVGDSQPLRSDQNPEQQLDHDHRRGKSAGEHGDRDRRHGCRQHHEQERSGVYIDHSSGAYRESKPGALEALEAGCAKRGGGRQASRALRAWRRARRAAGRPRPASSPSPGSPGALGLDLDPDLVAPGRCGRRGTCATSTPRAGRPPGRSRTTGGSRRSRRPTRRRTDGCARASAPGRPACRPARRPPRSGAAAVAGAARDRDPLAVAEGLGPGRRPPRRAAPRCGG